MGIRRSYDLERRWNGHSASFFTSISDQLRYNHLCNLEKVLIYTDYSPRLEGDKRYQAADQPSVTVNLVALPDHLVRLPAVTACMWCRDITLAKTSIALIMSNGLCLPMPIIAVHSIGIQT